jgi:hypothetical protein
VRELGEVLKEYQGRIEIKTVREFIALSKHQCELAGMVITSEREMKGNPVFEVVHYGDAYGLNHASGVAGGEAYGVKDKNTDGSSYSSFSGLTGESSVVASEKQKPLDAPIKSEHDREEHNAGSGLRPEPHISDRQLVQGSGTDVHGQGFSDREISGSGLPVSGYKLGTSRSRPEPANHVSGVAGVKWSLHGIIKHPTGVPAENIRVQVDMGAKGESVLCLDEITDREGRFSFETKEVIRPPDRFIIRGELVNRLMREPLKDAQVHITIGGEDGRAFSAVTDYRGRFAAGDGAPEHRRRAEPLWTEVEKDEGPQFYEWDMGWDDDYP